MVRRLADGIYEFLDTIYGRRIRGNGDGLGISTLVWQSVKYRTCFLAAIGAPRRDVDFRGAGLQDARCRSEAKSARTACYNSNFALEGEDVLEIDEVCRGHGGGGQVWCRMTCFCKVFSW